ncbi:MAG: hypothetical protein IT269_09775 [Saprospiraceae bacterium]|nr:hypothetical protein [Saprospiraceae bacterium]
MKKHIVIAVSLLTFFTQAFAQQPVKKDSIPATDKHLAVKFRFFRKYYEGNQRIGRLEFLDKLATDPSSFKKYKSGRNWVILGGVIGIPSAWVFARTIGSALPGGQLVYKNRLALSLLGTATATVLDFKGKSKMRKAVRDYNRSIDSGIGYHFNINEDGVGLAIQF